MKTVVIIPTYNERENIGKLINLLEEEFARIPNHEMSILVIDGNSPDGTAEAVRQVQQKWGNIHLLIEEEKKGLGAASVQAMNFAMKDLGAEIVATIDGDLSHDPRDLKRLLAAVDQGADFVIGSRYVRGGSIPADWGPHRKLLSFFGNIVARVLGVWGVHDHTPAFRAIRVDRVLSRVVLDETMPSGYAFQVALVCRAHDLGAKLAEVPVHFEDRTKGKSKMPPGNIFETLGFLLKYRIGKVL